MPINEIDDPRLQALFGTNDPRVGSVRPVVRVQRRGLPATVLASFAVVVALLLFSALNNRRTSRVEPSLNPQAMDREATAWPAPPPLYIPPVAQPAPGEKVSEAQKPMSPISPTLPAPKPREPTPAVATSLAPYAPSITPPAPPAPQRTSTGAPLVIDAGQPTSPTITAPTSSGNAAAGSATPTGVVRMRASTFANPSMTVPQGYLIPAVLETGFDSTSPGYARAIVSRDVRGFDGKNVLIPRGSRLVGEYKSAIEHGQGRAVIDWTRLIRPDGMTIALNSPAVDPVGRGGVPASVNSHFFARLGNALLQSTFAIGQTLTGRAVTGPVVVLPGNTANAAAQSAASPRNYEPTLKIRPGKSISVFVAQDLEFGAAGVIE